MENKTHMVNLGKFISERRKAKGYTQQEVADVMNIAVKTVSYIESGRNYPTLKNLFKLAEVLDISIDKFVFGYSRFDSSLNITEINEMMGQLNPKQQGLVLNIVRAACQSMLDEGE